MRPTPGTLQAVQRTAEDGLDPTDCLTEREALARIVWLLRTNKSVEKGYEAQVGITELTEWSYSESGSHACAAYRRHLEAVGLISGWSTNYVG